MQKDFKFVKKEWPFRRGGNYHITFKGEELILPSVTTILGDTLPKKFLVHWAAKQAAIAALENPALSIEEAVGAIYKKRDAAGGLGKTVHSWAEDISKGNKIDLNNLTDDLKPYGEAFLKFVNDQDLKVGTLEKMPLAEFTVFNPEVGYAGTCDFATDKYIYDWKTGKNIYIDHHLQQIAYLNATHVLLPDKETVVPMPKFEGAFLVHLRKSGRYSSVEAEGTFEDFLAVFNLYKILKKFDG